MIIDTWFLLALGSAIFSAGAALSQKEVLFELDAMVFSFLLFLFVALFSMPVIVYSDFSGITFAGIAALYVRSVLGAFSFLFVMLSIKNMEISRALPLLALTPGIVALFAFILLKDSLSAIQIGGMFLLLAGTYVLETRAGKDLFEPFKVFIKSKSHHYILGALLLFAVTAITDRALLNNYKFQPEAYFLLQQLFYAFNFSIMIILAGRGKRNLSLLKDLKLVKWLVLIAVLTVAYRFTEISAIKIAPVALVLSVKRISIFIAVIAGGKLFREENLLKKIIASAVILAGSFLITM